jgi:hypothetical protein
MKTWILDDIPAPATLGLRPTTAGSGGKLDLRPANPLRDGVKIAVLPPTAETWREIESGPGMDGVTWYYRIESGPAHYARVHLEQSRNGRSPGTMETYRQIVRDHNAAPELAADNARLRGHCERFLSLLGHCERFLSLLDHARVPGEITQTPESIAELRAALALAEGGAK